MRNPPYGSSREDLQRYKTKELEQKLSELEKDMKEVASLILTTGYIVNEQGDRVMNANEYKWLDVACKILKKYHKRD